METISEEEKARIEKAGQYKYKLVISNLQLSADAGYLPILRRLSSMTEEELNEIFSEQFAPSLAREKIYQMSKSLYGFHTVLSHFGDWDTEMKLRAKGFDLNNLIDSGEAIEKKD